MNKLCSQDEAKQNTTDETDRSRSLLQFYSLLFLLLVVVQSHSRVWLWPHGLQHARPHCPSLSPRVCPSSCPLHQWCHTTMLSSVTLFSSCPQSFPESGTFPMSHLFASDDQNTGASASASVLPVSIQGWSPLRLTGLFSLLSEGLSGVFSSTTVQRHQFFGVLPSLRSSSHNQPWPLGRPQPWLYGPLSAEQRLCFSTHCLGLSSLSRQEAVVFRFHGCSEFRAKKRESVTTSPFRFYLPWSNGAGCHGLSVVVVFNI